MPPPPTTSSHRPALQRLRDLQTLTSRLTPLVFLFGLLLAAKLAAVGRGYRRLLTAERFQAIHDSLHDALTGYPIGLCCPNVWAKRLTPAIAKEPPLPCSHNMTYDSSFTRRGISWPTQSKQYKIWQLGMAEFPVHGTSHFQITMDYNFYYTQRGGTSNGVTAAQSAADSAQVQATYQDMYNATSAGNRAPLMLGNHFNAWNNSAYSKALGGFLLANCAKAGTYCVPFRDVVAWMKMQDPSVLASLQKQAPEFGPPAT